MCGIAGSLVFNGGSFHVTHDYLANIRDTMTHRGPDGRGIWVSADSRVGLAHRRLSIVDLSGAAAQPMCNEDETLWVSFNGEIYNHAGIKRELQQVGNHRWKTHHSDTEVILHAFEQWGIDCVDRFRGMFAFALWDSKVRELWLVRDRIGIKPLYYCVHHNRFTFASEIKALFEDPEQRRQIDEEAFYHYLSFLTTPAPLTMFAGIRKLRPATWMRVKENGDIYERRYWDVWDHTMRIEGTSEDAIAAQLLDELRTSIKLRKMSDVPVGVFLSGGLDSSTNAVLFSDSGDTPVKTFTTAYTGNNPSYRNETSYARQIALQVGAEYHERLLNTEDLLAFLPKMIHLQDEPIGDPVCVPVYYLAQLARNHGVTVCQLGEGADELFCGYPKWKTMLQLQHWSGLPLSHYMQCAGDTALKLIGKEQTWHYELLRRVRNGQPVFWGGAEAFTQAQKQQLLHSDLRKRFAGFTSWDCLAPIRRRFEEGAPVKSHLNWMTYLDLNIRLPDLLLMRVDKMTMGASIEARVPFLDHKVVELAMSIPEALKIKGGTLKYILKKAVRGLVPDDIIDRTKQGFAVPIREWLAGSLGSFARRELNNFCADTAFLHWPEVERVLTKGDIRRVWYLLNFALMWKHCIAGYPESLAGEDEPLINSRRYSSVASYAPRLS